MIVQADTDSEVTWARLAWLFSSVEAIAFAAAGALFGAARPPRAAEKAESEARKLAGDAARGRALAATLKAEAAVSDEGCDAGPRRRRRGAIGAQPPCEARAGAVPRIAMANWAVVIGVDRYWTERACLKGAVRDALSMREWLLDPAGGNVPAENMALILSPLEGKEPPGGVEYVEATNSKLITAINDLLVRSAGKGDASSSTTPATG